MELGGALRKSNRSTSSDSLHSQCEPAWRGNWRRRWPHKSSPPPAATRACSSTPRGADRRRQQGHQSRRSRAPNPRRQHHRHRQSGDPIKVITVPTTGFDPAASGSRAAVECVATLPRGGTSSFVGAEIAKLDRPELTAAKVIVSGGRLLFNCGANNGDQPRADLRRRFISQLKVVFGSTLGNLIEYANPLRAFADMPGDRQPLSRRRAASRPSRVGSPLRRDRHRHRMGVVRRELRRRARAAGANSRYCCCCRHWVHHCKRSFLADTRYRPYCSRQLPLISP